MTRNSPRWLSDLDRLTGKPDLACSRRGILAAAVSFVRHLRRARTAIFPADARDARNRIRKADYAKKWPERRSHCCFLLTGTCQTRNSGIGMCESDSRHDPVAHGSGHTTTEGRSMDRSLVQAKTRRSRSAIASDIGNGTMNLAARRNLRATRHRRSPAHLRCNCLGLRCVGTREPCSGLDPMLSWESIRLPSTRRRQRANPSRSRNHRQTFRNSADQPAMRSSAQAFSINRPTGKVVKRSIYR